MSKFKVGDTARRTKGTCFNQSHGEGFVGKVAKITDDYGTILEFTDGSYGYADSYELVAPTGPVRTETVTKRHIVPGVYGRLEVVDSDEKYAHLRLVAQGIAGQPSYAYHLTATELDELAMVASQLAEALRDA